MEIALSSRKYPGKIAVIDDVDVPLIAAVRTWGVEKDGNNFYARGRMLGTRRLVRMHQLILPGARRVDHADRDTLNNRRRNLRPASQMQNAANREPQANNSSGFKGVARDRGRWKAYITKDQQKIHLGCFGTAEEAARAYDRKARELFGEYACLNFAQPSA